MDANTQALLRAVLDDDVDALKRALDQGGGQPRGEHSLVTEVLKVVLVALSTNYNLNKEIWEGQQKGDVVPLQKYRDDEEVMHVMSRLSKLQMIADSFGAAVTFN
ncbi:hypothetical protein RI054_02g07010 [Pseudoscourfieldia marina]